MGYREREGIEEKFRYSSQRMVELERSLRSDEIAMEELWTQRRNRCELASQANDVARESTIHFDSFHFLLSTQSD